MNKILLLAVCLGITVQADAQRRPLPGASKPFSHLKARTSNILAKQQATSNKGGGPEIERLIGASTYTDYGETFVDSSRYVYSGSRFSDVNNMNPNSYSDDYDPTEPLLPEILAPTWRNYLQYDTAYKFEDGGMTIGDLTETVTKLYDDQNRPTSIFVNYGGTEHYRALISYVGTEELIDSLHLQRDTSFDLSGSYETLMRLYTGYDLSGRRIADTTYDDEANSVDVHHYTYSPEGLLLQTTAYEGTMGMPLDLTGRSTYTYDLSSRLVAAFEEADYGAGLESDALDSFYYSGSSMLYTMNKTFYYEDTTAELYLMTTATLTSFGAFDEYTVAGDFSASGTLEPIVKLKFDYNSGMHITKMAAYYAEESDFETEASDIQNYYYIDIPTSVAALPAVVTHTLYPNPATGNLTITGSGQMKVTIYNLSGKVVLQQTGMADALGMHISVGALPAGTYVAEVSGAQGRSNLKFVKQ